MAETHELRLKIDAGAAKGGAREFSGAIAAIKQAVRDLERDSSGAFTKLRKNIKDVSALGSLKVGVDKQAVRDLNAFADGLKQVTSASATSQKQVKSLATQVNGLGEAYRFAKGTADQMSASILKTNSALMRQIQLASQARSAVRQVRTAPSAEGAGVVAAVSAGQGGAARASQQMSAEMEASQARIQNAIAKTRGSVESLTTSLMKVGGFGAMNALHLEMNAFMQVANKAGVTTRELSNAQLRLSTAATQARTSLTTLNTIAAEDTRAQKAAAAAKKANEAATTSLARSTLSASGAITRAEGETMRLTHRLREMGGTDAASNLNRALITLKASLSGGHKSALEVRAAMLQFSDATNAARNAITHLSGSHAQAKAAARAQANETRALADAARMAERELRSIAGANEAVSKSFRNATGNMRGMENAFNATYQAGTLFRNMLGSITLGTFVREVFQAGDALDQFKTSMEVATGSKSGAMGELDYVTDVAARLGINLQSARSNYAKFAVASNIAGVSAKSTQKVFESVSTALAVMGKGTVDQNLAFMALEQMMSKGCHAPGTLIRMADGSVKIVEDIVPGDELMGPDGLPRVVLVLAHGHEEMFRIVPSQGEAFEVNLHHKLQVIRAGKMETLVVADYLTDPEKDELTLAHDVWAGVSFHAESVGIGPYHGFLISDDHLYLDAQGFLHHNTVSSEELRQQLGERLPGAANMMAQALGVSMDELGKLLKAGSIKSADALPKFADVLMEKFGPGLEEASKRAGNNLQKLQNEIQLFLETVAQSGFMQELAVQFKDLTQMFASGEMDGVARKLGDGLASAARVAGNAMGYLVENGEKVITVVKALVAAMVVSKVASFGSALAASSVQMAGYVQTFATARTAKAADTAATVANSQATVANVATVNAAAAARARGQALLASSTATTRALTTATAANTAANAASTSVWGAVANGAKHAGSAATFLMRGLSILGPVAAGVSITLSLFPGIMNAFGDATEKTALQIDGALSRSGVKFEELGNTMREAATATAMHEILHDINLLADAVETLGNSTRNMWQSWLGVSVMDEAILAIGKATMDLSTFDNMLATIGLWNSDIDVSALSKMTESGKQQARELMAGVLDLTKGQGDAVALQKKLNDLVQQFPEARGAIVEMYGEFIAQGVKAEKAILANERRLTAFLGTEDDKAILNFVKLAETVYKTGEGMDALQKKYAEIGKETPALAEPLKKVMDQLNDSMVNGHSQHDFNHAVRTLYDGTAQHIKKLGETAREARDVHTRAVQEMHDKAASLSAMHLPTVGALGVITPAQDTTALDSFREMLKEFDKSSNIQASADRMQMFVTTLTAATPEVKGFTDEVMKQFSALSAQEQTYQRLDTILAATAPKFAANSVEVAKVSEQMRAASLATGQSAVAYSDLLNAFNSMPWPTEAIREAAMEALGLAESAQKAGNEAYAAQSGLNSAADGADEIGAAAAAARDKVAALTAALSAISAVGAGVKVKASEIIDNINFETQLKTMHVAEREGARFAREQAKVIDAAFNEEFSKLSQEDKSGAAGYKLFAEKLEQEKMLPELQKQINAAAMTEYSTKGWEDPNKSRGRKGGGGGGGRGRKAALNDEQKLVDSLNKSLKERARSLVEERIHLEVLAQGYFETEEGARLFSEAMIAGGGAVDETTLAMIRQIDVASRLNEELKKAAKDPVKEWMRSVPGWIEAGNKIEMDAIGAVKNSLADFIKTGKFDIESLGDAILGTIADIVADKAMKEMLTFLGRGEAGAGGWLGGALGSIFSSHGDTVVPGMNDQGTPQAMLNGANQAGPVLTNAIVQGGQQLSQMIQASLGTGGAQAAGQVQSGLAVGATQVRTAGQQGLAIGSTNIRTATATGGAQLGQGVVQGATQGAPILAQGVAAGSMGGGGGGILGSLGGWGGIASMVLGAFSEGGYSNSPVGFASAPAAAFHGAPHYAEGTANTDGIPAILHPNEAVIPLSRGRKVPVELGDAAGGGNTTVVNQTFNITTADADSFRKSQKQIAADMAASGQRAMSQNR